MMRHDLARGLVMARPRVPDTLGKVFLPGIATDSWVWKEGYLVLYS
jgi:hypothetical protein